jgi:hypothetical protein
MNRQVPLRVLQAVEVQQWDKPKKNDQDPTFCLHPGHCCCSLPEVSKLASLCAIIKFSFQRQIFLVVPLRSLSEAIHRVVLLVKRESL